jgi:hypothetical protein
MFNDLAVNGNYNSLRQNLQDRAVAAYRAHNLKIVRRAILQVLAFHLLTSALLFLSYGRRKQTHVYL